MKNLFFVLAVLCISGVANAALKTWYLTTRASGQVTSPPIAAKVTDRYNACVVNMNPVPYSVSLMLSCKSETSVGAPAFGGQAVLQNVSGEAIACTPIFRATRGLSKCEAYLSEGGRPPRQLGEFEVSIY